MTAILKGGFDPSALPKSGPMVQAPTLMPARRRKLRLEVASMLLLLPIGVPWWKEGASQWR
jgi:hypothetical protein